ncbi:MAG: hypothetical protein II961_09295 [Candidatus Riflebacteria bacterium]|nr:hypothetical protein [Candidatus Riflebacteria bacterium]
MNILSSFTNCIFKGFSLLIVSIILVFVPLKILSYGWSPNYAMLISSALTQNGDIPLSDETIKESIKTNTTIYDKAKEKNLIYIVTSIFILFNIIGLCSSLNITAWFASMSILMLANGNFILRILNCSPQILLCLLLLSVITIFIEDIKENPKSSSLGIIFYIFILRIIIPPEVYSINEMNLSYSHICSLQLPDFVPIIVENCWLFFAFIILWIKAYKKGCKIINNFNNPILFSALFLQLIINFGYIDLALFRDTLLLIWFSQQISEIIQNASCFKQFRVKFCMGLYILSIFTILATHDGLGRYSKTAIETTPVDFSCKELQSWAPEADGIIYNDNLNFAISQYYQNPDSKISYIYLNNFSLFKKEKENILNIQKMIKDKKIPLPDYYEEWVEQMRPQDRLITSEKINGLDNIEWLQCGRKLWIGRLKI